MRSNLKPQTLKGLALEKKKWGREGVGAERSSWTFISKHKEEVNMLIAISKKTGTGFEDPTCMFCKLR